MDEDWDNLLLLDACRYDMFKRLNSLDGDLQSRRSAGSATIEFVQNNFVGNVFNDTVYVNSNPFVSMNAGNSFHYLLDVWKTDWNEEYDTVVPEDISDAIRNTNENYPDKRLIGHFMQPHHPFIGPAGSRISATSGNDPARQRVLGNQDQSTVAEDSVWQQVEQGNASLDKVIEAYDENLSIVLDEVEKLAKTLPGKTVITSDHGNLLDEPAYPVISTGSRRFAHPKYATATPLVDVPWFVCPFNERRDVISEKPTADQSREPETETVSNRLEALGYK